MKLNNLKLATLCLTSSQLFFLFDLSAEITNINKSNQSLIKWEKTKEKQNNQKPNLIWNLYKESDKNLNFSQSEDNKLFPDLDLEGKSLNYFLDFSTTKHPTRINSFIPINNFYKTDKYSTSTIWKSAFNGGAAGGTGHQNISFRFDYGLNDETLLSLFLSESDDPLYNYIEGKVIPNYWGSIGLGIKKKLFESADSRSTLSLAPSIEHWTVSSGSGVRKSIFNEINDSVGHDKFEQIIASLTIPFSRKLSEKTNILIVPGASFLPSKLGNRYVDDNFYGHNYYLSTAFTVDVSKKLKILGSYTYLFGPGNNYFNKDLVFSRKPIYSYGINWNINEIIGIEGKITNSYGNTPATGHLTIPSDNKPLYYLGWKYEPNSQDTILKKLSSQDKLMSYGGVTVNNALIPEYKSSEITFNYDSHGNLFTSYRYSLSNIFQLEFLNIGNFKDVELYNTSNKKEDFKSIYLSDDNFNYRFGGKLLIFSPQKDDLLWTSLRTSVGRNSETQQGYIFSEIINTIRLNKNIAANLSPKYFFSGAKNLSAIGTSLYINLSDKFQVIPELNFGLSKLSETNSTLSLRYSYHENKSIDMYVSNAIGQQDLGQMLRTKNAKFGFKLNFLF